MNAPFAQTIAAAQYVINALHDAGIHEDDPDFLALVESETDALERLRRILRAARYEEAHAKALKEMESELKERRSRKEAKADTLRAIVKAAMTQIGLPKLESPDFTASLAAGRPAVVIEDEEAIPSQLCVIKRQPDKTAIKKALEQGETVPGAALSEATPTLTVRTK